MIKYGSIYSYTFYIESWPGAQDSSFLAGGGVLAAVRADVRDFEDRTDAIFPVCFLAGFAGEPVRSKKNVILPNSGITETI